MKRTFDAAFDRDNDEKLHKRARIEQNDNCFAYLPIEIFDLILSYLEKKISRLQIRTVCRQWFDWTGITHFKLGKIWPEEIAAVVECFSKYDQIGLHFLNCSKIMQASEQLSKLNSLSQLTELNIAAECAVSSLINLRALTMLSIDVDTLTRLSNLTRLSAKHIDNTKGHIHLPNQLVSLSFESLEDTTRVSKSLTQLTELSVKQLDLDPKFFNHTPNLRKLTSMIGHVTYRDYTVNLPFLEDLETDAPLFGLPSGLTRIHAPYVYSSGWLDHIKKPRHVVLSTIPSAWEEKPQDFLTDLVNFQLLPNALMEGFLLHISDHSKHLTSLAMHVESNFTVLAKLHNLEWLKLHSFIPPIYPEAYSQKNPLLELDRLTALIIDRPGRIEFDNLTTLTQLRKLHMNFYRSSLTSFDFLTSFTNLTNLALPIFGVEGVPALDQLRVLKIFGCEIYNDLSGFTSLTKLSVGCGYSYSDERVWNDMVHMTRLRKLILMEEPKESYMAKLTALKYLNCIKLYGDPDSDLTK